jgi:RNA polymerase sigma factor (sigma-70 family)
MQIFCLSIGWEKAISVVMTDELIPTRVTLLLRLKDWQDQAGWQDFFDTYWSMIFGLAVKSGLSQAEAEDVVQETLVAVAKLMPDFKYDPSVGSFKGWLLNQTRWRIADHLRRRQRRETFEVQPPTDGSVNVELPLHDPEKIWDEEWEKAVCFAAVARAKRKVDPAHWQVFDCHVVKGWSAADTAEALDVSVGQVYLIKHRLADVVKAEAERLKTEML